MYVFLPIHKNNMKQNFKIPLSEIKLCPHQVSGLTLALTLGRTSIVSFTPSVSIDGGIQVSVQIQMEFGLLKLASTVMLEANTA